VQHISEFPQSAFSRRKQKLSGIFFVPQRRGSLAEVNMESVEIIVRIVGDLAELVQSLLGQSLLCSSAVQRSPDVRQAAVWLQLQPGKAGEQLVECVPLLPVPPERGEQLGGQGEAAVDRGRKGVSTEDKGGAGLFGLSEKAD